MACQGGIVKAINILTECFKTYAGGDADQKTLSKTEMKELLQKELGIMLKDCKDKEELSKFFNDLDANRDGTVNFQEYMVFIACITVICCPELQ